MRRVVGRYARRICPRREGLQRISLGKFPSVMYTGYADLLPKTVSWVLSDEMMRGTTVAPGLDCSSSF